MKTDSLCQELAQAEFHRSPINSMGMFELALHDAAPVGDDQKSNEIKNRGYGRVQVSRDPASWQCEARKVTNLGSIVFPTVTEGEASAKFISIGIGGKIRRVVKLVEAVSLKPNRRCEFAPGSIEVKESDAL